MIELARQFGKIDDPTVRQDIMRAKKPGDMAHLPFNELPKNG